MAETSGINGGKWANKLQRVLYPIFETCIVIRPFPKSNQSANANTHTATSNQNEGNVSSCQYFADDELWRSHQHWRHTWLWVTVRWRRGVASNGKGGTGPPICLTCTEASTTQVCATVKILLVYLPERKIKYVRKRNTGRLIHGIKIWEAICSTRTDVSIYKGYIRELLTWKKAL